MLLNQKREECLSGGMEGKKKKDEGRRWKGFLLSLLLFESSWWSSSCCPDFWSSEIRRGQRWWCGMIKGRRRGEMRMIPMQPSTWCEEGEKFSLFGFLFFFENLNHHLFWRRRRKVGTGFRFRTKCYSSQVLLPPLEAWNTLFYNSEKKSSCWAYISFFFRFLSLQFSHPLFCMNLQFKLSGKKLEGKIRLKIRWEEQKL